MSFLPAVKDKTIKSLERTFTSNIREDIVSLSLRDLKVVEFREMLDRFRLSCQGTVRMNKPLASCSRKTLSNIQSGLAMQAGILVIKSFASRDT